MEEIIEKLKKHKFGCFVKKLATIANLIKKYSNVYI